MWGIRKKLSDGTARRSCFQLPWTRSTRRTKGYKVSRPRRLLVQGTFHGGVFDDSSSDSDDERPPITTGRALFVTQAEARAQLELLWKNDGEGCDALLGSIVCTSQKNDDKAADKFFLDLLGVPPPRFRPAQTVGGVLAEHPQECCIRQSATVEQADPRPEGRRL